MGNEVIWETLWSDEVDGLLTLQGVLHKGKMSFEVVGDARFAATFVHLADAEQWLHQHGFRPDTPEATALSKPPRRHTPQQKKQLSYERDSRVVPSGQGASRRAQQQFAKLRRRQLRRRLKAYMRRQLNTLFREVNDQSLRSIRLGDIPHYGEEMPLREALIEKKRRKIDGEKTTRPDAPFISATRSNVRRADSNTDSDLPDWLRNF